MGVGDQLGSGQCDDSDDDDDLEAELAALSVGIPKKPKKGGFQVICLLMKLCFTSVSQAVSR